MNNRATIGKVVLLIGSLLLAGAVFLGTGFLGGGTMYFISAGLGMGAFLSYIVSAVCLMKIPQEPGKN